MAEPQLLWNGQSQAYLNNIYLVLKLSPISMEQAAFLVNIFYIFYLIVFEDFLFTKLNQKKTNV